MMTVWTMDKLTSQLTDIDMLMKRRDKEEEKNA